ncbi:MAG: hypothetical protein ACYDAQ_10570, partial [Mycobacteriales bacterium]
MTPTAGDAHARARTRDVALARVRRVTTFAAVGGVASIGVLSAAVAGTIPGRAHPAGSSTTTGTSQGGSATGLQPPASGPQSGYGDDGGYGYGGGGEVGGGG